LIVLWESSDRICSKRLKQAIPSFLTALEYHGRLILDEEIRNLILSVSPATIDRLLAPVRVKAGLQRKRRRMTRLKKKIPVKTSMDWSDTEPGYFEIDFVVHSGGYLTGHPIYTITITDVSSTWTDYIPLLAREQHLVTEALDIFRKQLPMPMLGINVDNDSAFINETLIEYCLNNSIEFTRSRPGKKNDQAWVEQKNGSIIRKIAGYDRYEGYEAGRLLCKLFNAARLFTNFFQPSFKLREKIREGAKVRKIYDTPITPYKRLLLDDRVSIETKQKLKKQFKNLDPVLLLKQMREAQAGLVDLSQQKSEEISQGSQSLEDFVNRLPDLWKLGEVRPTHRKKLQKPRTWQTYPDAFENVMPQILIWLDLEPDRTAKELFQRLQRKYPGEFEDCQLRTLQRRIKAWREKMARELISLYTADDINSDESTTVMAR